MAGAAPKGDEAGFKCFCVTGGIEKTQHQHLAGFSVLHDSRHEAIHLFKVNAFHSFIPWFGFVAIKNPPALVAGGLVLLFEISLAELVQAMAVRRHGGPMMMVVTVMAVALHLELR